MINKIKQDIIDKFEKRPVLVSTLIFFAIIFLLILFSGFFSVNNETSQPTVCTSDWSCGDWSECTEGVQTRTCIDSNSCHTSENKPSEKQSCTVQRSYVDEDLDTLWIYFVSSQSPYTDLQKDENFKKYKGKWIKSSGVILSVDDGLFGGVTVGLMSPDNPYLREATLYFDDNERAKLLNYNQYDNIEFEGEISGYNSLIGVTIQKAELR